MPGNKCNYIAQIKEYEMSRACSTHRKEAECIQDFSVKDRKASLKGPIHM
jgi:hypothetical protein